jgi:hypothetical protein
MERPTLFDVISDRIIWICDTCPVCDQDLVLRDDEEILMRVYTGSQDHTVMVGYHRSCFVETENMLGLLDSMK